MPLTYIEILNAKPREKPYKKADGNGLFVLIKPNGSKLWRWAYRIDGKQKTLAIGCFPAIKPEAARKKRQAAWEALKSGTDPVAKKKRDALAERHSRETTFRVVADAYIDRLKREGRAQATLQKNEWLLSLAKPLWSRPIREIAEPEILEVLRKQEQRERLDSANSLRSVIGSVFRFGVANAMADRDPTQALRGALRAPKVKHRAAIIDPKEFGGLLRAIYGFQGQPTTHAALKLLAYLFPRPGELRRAEWREFDLDQAVWTIPASRAKMRREHRIPLPSQAVAILRKLHIITGGGRLAFPGLRTPEQPISENTINAALRRLGFSQDEMTSHGFRATACSLLNESGKWHPDAIERALAHVEKK